MGVIVLVAFAAGAVVFLAGVYVGRKWQPPQAAASRKGRAPRVPKCFVIDPGAPEEKKQARVRRSPEPGVEVMPEPGEFQVSV